MRFSPDYTTQYDLKPSQLPSGSHQTYQDYDAAHDGDPCDSKFCSGKQALYKVLYANKDVVKVEVGLAGYYQSVEKLDHPAGTEKWEHWCNYDEVADNGYSRTDTVFQWSDVVDLNGSGSTLGGTFACDPTAASVNGIGKHGPLNNGGNSECPGAPSNVKTCKKISYSHFGGANYYRYQDPNSVADFANQPVPNPAPTKNWPADSTGFATWVPQPNPVASLHGAVVWDGCYMDVVRSGAHCTDPGQLNPAGTLTQACTVTGGQCGGTCTAANPCDYFWSGAEPTGNTYSPYIYHNLGLAPQTIGGTSYANGIENSNIAWEYLKIAGTPGSCNDISGYTGTVLGGSAVDCSTIGNGGCDLYNGSVQRYYDYAFTDAMDTTSATSQFFHHAAQAAGSDTSFSYKITYGKSCLNAPGDVFTITTDTYGDAAVGLIQNASGIGCSADTQHSSLTNPLNPPPGGPCKLTATGQTNNSDEGYTLCNFKRQTWPYVNNDYYQCNYRTHRYRYWNTTTYCRYRRPVATYTQDSYGYQWYANGGEVVSNLWTYVGGDTENVCAAGHGTNTCPQTSATVAAECGDLAGNKLLGCVLHWNPRYLPSAFNVLNPPTYCYAKDYPPVSGGSPPADANTYAGNWCWPNHVASAVDEFWTYKLDAFDWGANPYGAPPANTTFVPPLYGTQSQAISVFVDGAQQGSPSIAWVPIDETSAEDGGPIYDALQQCFKLDDWHHHTNYNVGQRVNANGYALECTVAGHSGAAAPNPGPGLDPSMSAPPNTVADGGVTWTILSEYPCGMNCKNLWNDPAKYSLGLCLPDNVVGSDFTPLYGVLDNAATYLNSVIDGTDGLHDADAATACRPYYVLILTDGAEGTAYTPHTSVDFYNKVDALHSLHSTVNAHTFVVGYGNIVDKTTLDAMAQAGGHALDPVTHETDASCDSSGRCMSGEAYSAANSTDLATKLNKIFTTLTSGVFQRSKPVLTSDGKRLYSGYFAHSNATKEFPGFLDAFDVTSTSGTTTVSPGPTYQPRPHHHHRHHPLGAGELRSQRPLLSAREGRGQCRGLQRRCNSHGQSGHRLRPQRPRYPAGPDLRQR
jgi:hypothetical protein